MREAKELIACTRRLPKLYERVKKLETREQDAGTDVKFSPPAS